MPKYKKHTLKKNKLAKHKTNKTRYMFKNRKYKLYKGGNTIQPTYVPYKDGGAFNNLYTSLNKNMIQSDANASTDTPS